MSVLDAPMRQLAKCLTKTFGEAGTIEYVATAGYNTTTGKARSLSVTEVDVWGVVEDYDDAEINGTTIRRGDLKYTVPAKDIDQPQPNDIVRLTFDGVDYKYSVLSVRPVHSGDERALFTLQLRL